MVIVSFNRAQKLKQVLVILKFLTKLFVQCKINCKLALPGDLISFHVFSLIPCFVYKAKSKLLRTAVLNHVPYPRRLIVDTAVCVLKAPTSFQAKRTFVNHAIPILPLKLLKRQCRVIVSDICLAYFEVHISSFSVSFEPQLSSPKSIINLN